MGKWEVIMRDMVCLVGWHAYDVRCGMRGVQSITK